MTQSDPFGWTTDPGMRTAIAKRNAKQALAEQQAKQRQLEDERSGRLREQAFSAQRAYQLQYGEGAVGAQTRGPVYLDTRGFDEQLGQQARARENQDWLAEQYRARIEGKGPSVAEQQLYAGRDAAIQQGMAMAASARGGAANQAAAARQAAFSANAATLQTNQQAGILRAQEIQQAMEGYGNLAQQRRAADLQAAGLTAQQAQAQAQLESQQRSQNDAMTQAYLQAQQNAAAQWQAQAQFETGMVNDNRIKEEERRLGLQQANQARSDRRSAALMGALGTVGGATIGAFAGGPAGAMAGGAIGSKLGG